MPSFIQVENNLFFFTILPQYLLNIYAIFSPQILFAII